MFAAVSFGVNPLVGILRRRECLLLSTQTTIALHPSRSFGHSHLSFRDSTHVADLDNCKTPAKMSLTLPSDVQKVANEGTVKLFGKWDATE